MHSKGKDNISCLRCSDRVFFPRAMMASHTRRRFTLCILFKGDNGMPCPIFSDRVCWPRFMMVCHARGSSTMYVAQMRRWHETSDIVRPCVILNGHMGIPRFISSNSMSSPRAIMACHARRRSSVCVVRRDADMPHPMSYNLL